MLVVCVHDSRHAPRDPEEICDENVVVTGTVLAGAPPWLLCTRKGLVVRLGRNGRFRMI
ncbi:hypothetical protein CJF30_00000493 [Rutstroemia sp. NJR-2017a BBW]|nr:hypothetical protein CJF30_00000493 [Rutstroemia sp. NJR-2017a BBW]